MTALRPERDSSSYGGEAAYGGADAFEAEAFQAAVEGLSDPLTDPLPGASGSRSAAEPQREWYGAQDAEAAQYSEDWSGQGHTQPQSQPQPQAQREPQASYEPGGMGTSYEPAPYDDAYAAAGHEHPVVDEETVRYRPLPVDEETVALRVDEARRMARAADEAISGAGSASEAGSASGAAGTAGASPASAPGGRAARRKAAKRQGRLGGAGGAHGAHKGAGAAQGGSGTRGARHGARHGAGDSEKADGTPLAAPRSRVEARRAARANKPSAGVVASRAIGEVFITTGVLMLLFVTYQLWWSNILASEQAGKTANNLQQEWASGKRAPGAFEPGQGFAMLHIPKLDVVVPVAEGISKSKVLDRGMVGHYDENSIKTAMPEDKKGNFGVAGHRNTHGEPFRYINRLKPGDPIVVETRDKYYVYDMASILPVTSPSNIGVLDPIPKGSGFTAAGRYITLTTCTPEFTSKYRMIVWGKMVEERPRSKGKPDALVQ
ncbi:class E sortase [Streptomyces acidicola]|uniref:class E sortase n=1 Tax=Streptomyces acidicola TaxID=2596892 RepID=UPI003796784B